MLVLVKGVNVTVKYKHQKFETAVDNKYLLSYAISYTTNL